eukprot:COSAG02_NODE_1664_length_11434_cov_51.455404_8_plen_232_part_00
MPSERGLFAFAKWIWYGVCSIRVARVLPVQHLYMRLGRLSGPCVQEYVRSHRPSSYTAVPYSCLTDEAPYKRPTGVAWKMFAVFFVLGGVCSTLIPLTYGSTRLVHCRLRVVLEEESRHGHCSTDRRIFLHKSTVVKAFAVELAQTSSPIGWQACPFPLSLQYLQASQCRHQVSTIVPQSLHSSASASFCHACPKSLSSGISKSAKSANSLQRHDNTEDQRPRGLDQAGIS